VLVSNKKSALFLKSYFKQIGIQDIIICPGSRNLPLIVNFSNDNYFNVYSILDERVAGFFALGIVKAHQKPAVVITTSGSAAINLAPAMAEAYYQRLPLIAITADRPSNFINRGENQTIIQRGLYSNYVGLELEIEEMLNFETFETKIQVLHQFLLNRGEIANVHINLSFSEPLDKVEHILGDFQLKLKPELAKKRELNSNSIKIKKGQNVIFYISTNTANLELNKILDQGVAEKNWVVISEMQSGWFNEKAISQIDLILSRDKAIQSADILITIGETMLSKKFRNYIKSNEKITHYDLSSYTRNWSNLTNDYHCIKLDYNSLMADLEFENTIEFQSTWLAAEEEALAHQSKFHNSLNYKEFNIVFELIQDMDDQSCIYWGNSSAVRYGNWTNWKIKSSLTHLTSRGVSGIEGVLATAIGYQASMQLESFYCILGDLSLIYELGSLSAMNYINNIKIIVINNHGGKIFEQIHKTEVLGQIKALTTPQSIDISSIAKLYDIEYFKSVDLNSFIGQWALVKASKSKLIFEINISNDEVGHWSNYFNN
jgi:2-succinyl-5-enolpyruvyl-6-hydroxy-3-cyclohexene-1-carboxylate synthase